MTDYLAVARHQIGEDTASIDLHLATTSRGSVVAAHAVQLLDDYGADPKLLAWIGAEAMTQLVEERLAARDRQAVAVEPITLDIPAPCDWISSNDRTGWRVKAKLTKQWRLATGWRAKEAGIKPMQRADIAVRVILPTARRRDPHNLIDTFKAACDGLVDVGVLPDDDSKRMTLTRIDLGEPDRTAERGILRLLITDRSGS